MDFSFNEEQDQFRAVVRRFVDQRWPIAETRRLADTATGYDPEVWRQMAGELGLTGLAIAEQYGGSGFGFLELGIALEELGRNLAGGPLFATTCLGATALANAASDAQKSELLPAVAGGESIVTLAVGEGDAPPSAEAVRCACRSDGSSWRLTGAKSFVVDGQNADVLIVAARAHGSDGTRGISLFAVHPGSGGVSVEPVEALDPTRRLAHVTLSDADGELLGDEGEAWPAIEKTLAQAAIAQSAEQVGGAARCLDMAVAYACERIQFGRQIGSFQAIKHRAAEVKLELELARSAAYWSWWVAGEDAAELHEAAGVAASMCSEAYLRAAAENIHIHGGMGVTWEHDAHLYYRRAKSSEVLLGDPSSRRRRLLAELGLAP